MGGWKLEVFKMGVYMSFPVVLFYYFNQPMFFEDWMMKKKDELFPRTDQHAREKLEKLKDYMEKRREEEWKKS